MKRMMILYIFLGIILAQSAWIQSLGLDDYDEVIRAELIEAIESNNYRVLPGGQSVIIRTRDGQEIELPIRHMHQLLPQVAQGRDLDQEDEDWADFIVFSDSDDEPEEEAEEQEEDKIAEVNEIDMDKPAQR